VSLRLPRLGYALFAVCSFAFASEQPDEAIDSDSEFLPEEILVTGEFPGPGMWKVLRADDPDAHTLWILGTPPPLPKKMKWKSDDVERTMLDSQEILLASAVNVKADKGIGFVRGLTLLPAALSARKNPDKEKLSDVLTPELYSRWVPLKRRHLGRSEGIERWRPIFAAYKLRNEAFDDLKLRENGVVWDALSKLAEKHDIKTTTPTVYFEIETKQIRAKIKEFARESLADAECFALTLDLVAAIADRDSMQSRASAWATGDLQSLASFEPLPNPNTACAAAIMGSQVAQQLLPNDLEQRLRTVWLEAAERSLTENRSTFALLPMAELTSRTGPLAALRARGYVVQPPEGAPALFD
jgi:hypothetical protein